MDDRPIFLARAETQNENRAASPENKQQIIK